VTQKNFGFSMRASCSYSYPAYPCASAYGTRFFDGETVVAYAPCFAGRHALLVQILISLLIIAIFAGAAALWDDDDLLGRCGRGGVEPAADDRRHFGAPPSARDATILPLYIALLLMTPLPAGAGAARRSADAPQPSAGIYVAAARSLSICRPGPLREPGSSIPSRGSSSSPSALVAGRRFKRGGIAYDARLFAACLAGRRDRRGGAHEPSVMRRGCWQQLARHARLRQADLDSARLVHFLALAYVVYHSGLTGLMRRTGHSYRCA